jgi:GT2 family glycosyltransferase
MGGCIVNWWTAKMPILNVNNLLSEFDKNYCVDASLLTGRGTPIPAHVFEDIGYYDEEHFQQCGDIELPARAKNHGYQLLISYAASPNLMSINPRNSIIPTIAP